MDRLANESAEFTHFYGNPLCSPSRASLMTGRNSYRTGILHTSRGGALISGDEVTATKLFTDDDRQWWQVSDELVVENPIANQVCGPDAIIYYLPHRNWVILENAQFADAEEWPW